MWRVYKAAGKPWPQLDSDEVVDYLVMEAVGVKVAKEDEDARKQAQEDHEKDKWRKESFEELDAYR